MSKRKTKGATRRSSKLHGSCRHTLHTQKDRHKCTNQAHTLPQVSYRQHSMHTCRYGDRVTIAQLLRCGAKIDPKDADGQTAGMIMLVGVGLRAEAAEIWRFAVP